MDDALVREDATGSALRPLPGGFPHGGGAAADFFEVNQNPAIADAAAGDFSGLNPALDGAGCDPHFSGGDGGDILGAASGRRLPRAAGGAEASSMHPAGPRGGVRASGMGLRAEEARDRGLTARHSMGRNKQGT